MSKLLPRYMASYEPINQKSELGKSLQQIADDKKVAIIGFVEPENPVRISPISWSSARIEPKEMYKLEKIICEWEEQGALPETLHLIVQTSGGELFTSYKIASYLRSKFKNIHAFVPYQAASGGTIICCAANTISMGDLGNLTPIDPQVGYEGIGRISAHAFERAVDEMHNFFGKLSPQELSPPWRQMLQGLDPAIFNEMRTIVRNTAIYAVDLLQQSGYDPDLASNIAVQLAYTKYSHPHCYLKRDVKELGFKIVEENDIIKVYKELVLYRLKEKTDEHIIDPIFPSGHTSPSSTSTAHDTSTEQPAA